MIRPKPFPKLAIPKPCHERWETMSGDDRSRFCGVCQKDIVNFSEFTEREAHKVLREAKNGVCARITPDANGNTRFRPEIRRSFAEKLVQISMLSASAMTAKAQICDLNVHVKGPTGAPIARESVKTTKSDTGEFQEVVSNSEGIAHFSAISGRYKVEVNSQSFRTFPINELSLACEITPQVNVEANMELGDGIGVIVVSAADIPHAAAGAEHEYHESLIHKSWRNFRRLFRKPPR